METNKTSSPASSITKLGIVKFSIPEGTTLPKEGGRRAIKELPSFSGEERARPAVQMPPLVDHRDSPEEVDDDLDAELEEAPPSPASARDRVSTLPGVVPFPAASRGSRPGIPVPAIEDAEPPAVKPAPDEGARRPAPSWWHGALLGAAMMMTSVLCPFGLVAFA